MSKVRIEDYLEEEFEGKPVPKKKREDWKKERKRTKVKKFRD